MEKWLFDVYQKNHKDRIQLLRYLEALNLCFDVNNRGDWCRWVVDIENVNDVNIIMNLIKYPYVDVERVKINPKKYGLSFCTHFDVAAYIGYPDDDDQFSDYDIPF